MHRLGESSTSRSPAQGLPDELITAIVEATMLYIKYHRKETYLFLSTMARICKRWSPAVTRLLYRSLVIDSLNTGLIQTMLEHEHLRLLVQEVSIIIRWTHDPSVANINEMLGWIALIPNDYSARLRLLSVEVKSKVAGKRVVDFLASAPALHLVTRLHFTGPIPPDQLLARPARLDLLRLHNVDDTTPYPHLPDLETLWLTNQAPTPLFLDFLRSLGFLTSLHLAFMTPEAIDGVLGTVSNCLRSLEIMPYSPNAPPQSIQRLACLEVLRVHVENVNSFDRPARPVREFCPSVRQLHLMHFGMSSLWKEANENAMLKAVALQPGQVQVVCLDPGVRISFQVRQMLVDAKIGIVEY